MSELLHLSHSFQVRAMAQEERTIDVIASSEAIDSYGEIVAQDWDLRRYLANPVVLWGHNSWGMPIGRASDVRVETGSDGKNQLLAKLHFVDAKANPMAEQVWQGIVQGSIRAVSVGFRTKNVSVKPIGTDKEILVLSGNELIEISVVPIPANPEALAIGKKTFDTLKALATRGAPTQPEKAPMSILVTLAAILSLPTDAKEPDVIDAIKRLETTSKERERSLGSILDACGSSSVDAALGVIAAGKDAIAKGVELAKKLDDMERDSVIEKAKAEKKLTPHQVKTLADKPLDFVKAFIELQVPIPALASEAQEKQGSHTLAAQSWNGKTWSELSPGEKHDLYVANHDLYEAMKAAASAA
jgi:HK97 family phage prohead protease